MPISCSALRNDKRVAAHIYLCATWALQEGTLTRMAIHARSAAQVARERGTLAGFTSELCECPGMFRDRSCPSRIGHGLILAAML